MTSRRWAAPPWRSSGRRVRGFQKNAQTLARLRLISPFSTAPASQLRGATAGLSTLPDCAEGVPGKDCVAEAFEDLLRPIGGTVGSPPFFFRTIGTDDGQIKLLVRELARAASPTTRPGG